MALSEVDSLGVIAALGGDIIYNWEENSGAHFQQMQVKKNPVTSAQEIFEYAANYNQSMLVPLAEEASSVTKSLLSAFNRDGMRGIRKVLQHGEEDDIPSNVLHRAKMRGLELARIFLQNSHISYDPLLYSVYSDCRKKVAQAFTERFSNLSIDQIRQIYRVFSLSPDVVGTFESAHTLRRTGNHGISYHL